GEVNQVGTLTGSRSSRDEGQPAQPAGPRRDHDMKSDPFMEDLIGTFEAAACTAPKFAGAALLQRAARMSLRAHVIPAVETEVHRVLRDVADAAAIAVFADNVRKLLLAAPFGPKAVLGID